MISRFIFSFIFLWHFSFGGSWAFILEYVSFSDFSGIRFAMSRYQTHETRMKRMALDGMGASYCFQAEDLDVMGLDSGRLE
jgi:hypothetical protein